MCVSIWSNVRIYDCGNNCCGSGVNIFIYIYSTRACSMRHERAHLFGKIIIAYFVYCVLRVKNWVSRAQHIKHKIIIIIKQFSFDDIILCLLAPTCPVNIKTKTLSKISRLAVVLFYFALKWIAKTNFLQCSSLGPSTTSIRSVNIFSLFHLLRSAASLHRYYIFVYK